MPVAASCLQCACAAAVCVSCHRFCLCAECCCCCYAKAQSFAAAAPAAAYALSDAAVTADAFLQKPGTPPITFMARLSSSAVTEESGVQV